jgi:regulator of protease activity HflC (stomatin/prohibitin superfamily)
MEISPLWIGAALSLLILASGLRVVRQYERGVLFRLGRVIGVREPGLTWIIPLGIDRLPIVNVQIVTLPIASQKIITRDNVSIDVAAVAYYRVTDAIKSVVEIQNLRAAIGEIAQTTVRNTIGQFSLDEVLSQTARINKRLNEIIDVQTEVWGAVVTLVELKDIVLPEGMQRAMAREAEAEREKRAKVIAADGEFLASQRLGQAADVISVHPIALQLRNLQTLLQIAAEKNSTIIFPSQFFSSMRDLHEFLAEDSHSIPILQQPLPSPDSPWTRAAPARPPVAEEAAEGLGIA